MCGRYSLTTTLDQLLPRLKGPLPENLLETYQPRLQVRPGEPLLIQRADQGQVEVSPARWGLVPSWLNDTSSHSRPINARSETVANKPFFRGPWRHRRCLIPADGFYEWRPTADQAPQKRPARKQPYWIRRQDHGLFWLGGLWDSWLAPDGITLETCCILTTTPNALLRPIHDRMPVVIPDGQEDTWLLASGADELRYLVPLLLPWQPAGWEAAPVDLP